MPNADILWQTLSANWPMDRGAITIREAEQIAPQGTGGVTNRSSYDFAMLTLLSNRRTYIRHLDAGASDSINGEVHIANRNNGIWRHFYESEIERQ